MKKALFLDLDNTIYPVSSVANRLFAEAFALLDAHASVINRETPDTLEKIKEEMTRKPFQHIAERYQLPEDLREIMTDSFRKLTFDAPMTPFEDYYTVRRIPLDKFLITTGFRKLQYSKVRSLGIEADFKEVVIVDPEESSDTKKDAFLRLIGRYGYAPAEILVVGDDPDSEIAAGRELGIETFLLAAPERYPNVPATFRGESLSVLAGIV